MLFDILAAIPLSLLVLVSFMSSSFASPSPYPSSKFTARDLAVSARDIPASQCTSGPLLCCITVQPANDPNVSALLGIMALNSLVQDPTTPVGVACGPMPMIGLGNHTCPSQVVCCSNNEYGGIVAIGCQNATINQ